MAAMIEHLGEGGSSDWAAVPRLELRARSAGRRHRPASRLVSGECDISISNTYYFARALRTDVDPLRRTARDDRLGLPRPGRERRAHVNLSGGGVAAHAPNRDAAVAFLEYLASDQAQSYFAAGNDEYPVVASVEVAASVQELGEFEADDVSLAAVAGNLPLAQQIFNEVGWE
jgi:iron(III) transport system substrate-binding protein